MVKRLKDLPPGAQAYVWAILGLGGGVLAWSLFSLPVGHQQWVTFVVLTLFAAAAQLFRAHTPKNHAYYVTIVFIFAGILLLPPGAIALLVVLAMIPEWTMTRRPGYVYLYNIANYLVSAVPARLIYCFLGGSPDQPPMHLGSLLAAMLAGVIFSLANHLLLAIFLSLAFGGSWRKTGLFEPENLFTDTALSWTGIVSAILWQVDPWLVSLVTALLFLIYRGLNTLNLREQARTDDKTGLYNARYFREVLSDELRRAKRFERPLSVIMADLDLLRRINNTYGHLAGDGVLKGTAQIIMRCLREYDIAARFGGEEFVILLPETDSAEALGVAERLRRQIEGAQFAAAEGARPVRATLSLGIASFPAHGLQPDELIHQADLAVYYAKYCGRNRSWVCSPESMALDEFSDRQPDCTDALGTGSSEEAPPRQQAAG